MGKAQGRRLSKTEEELHSATRNGDLNTIQSILTSDPLAVNSRDKHSRTPLHLAAWSGHTEVVTYLCKNRADVGAAAVDDMGAIHFAAQKGHLGAVRALISSRASLKSATRKGLTALHYASQGSHLELVKYLVRKGASLTCRTKAGKTPLDCAGNDETRSYLEGCENGESKLDDESVEKSPQKKEEESLGGDEGVELETAQVNDEGSKRKCSDESGEIVSEEPEMKKKKVVLSHLVTEDDTLDVEEAEGKNSNPVIPSDIKAILKICEALSISQTQLLLHEQPNKVYISSFRKDSEQTKAN